jgi:purine-binding chemotaxis protein CheW
VASWRARRAVLAKIGGRSLAVPVEHVVETMRPLPIIPLAIIPLTAEDNISDYVLGISRIRGEDCRVIDAARLLGVPAGPATRFLVVRDRGARVALRVDAVIDVRLLGDGAPVGPVAALGEALADARWIDEASA